MCLERWKLFFRAQRCIYSCCAAHKLHFQNIKKELAQLYWGLCGVLVFGNLLEQNIRTHRQPNACVHQKALRRSAEHSNTPSLRKAWAFTKNKKNVLRIGLLFPKPVRCPIEYLLRASATGQCNSVEWATVLGWGQNMRTTLLYPQTAVAISQNATGCTPAAVESRAAVTRKQRTGCFLIQHKNTT